MHCGHLEIRMAKESARREDAMLSHDDRARFLSQDVATDSDLERHDHEAIGSIDRTSLWQRYRRDHGAVGGVIAVSASITYSLVARA